MLDFETLPAVSTYSMSSSIYKHTDQVWMVCIRTDRVCVITSLLGCWVCKYNKKITETICDTFSLSCFNLQLKMATKHIYKDCYIELKVRTFSEISFLVLFVWIFLVNRRIQWYSVPYWNKLFLPTMRKEDSVTRTVTILENAIATISIAWNRNIGIVTEISVISSQIQEFQLNKL